MSYPVGDEASVTDILFDDADDLLLVTTSDGYFYAWSPETRAFVQTIKLGGHLAGMSLSEDGTKVLIAQHDAAAAPTDGNNVEHHTDTIYRLDLATSAYDTLTFPVSSNELGVLDVAVDASGRAFATTSASTTFPVPFHSFDAASGAPVVANLAIPTDQPFGGIAPDSYLIPSEHQRYILVLDNGGSLEPVDIYDSRTGGFIAHRDLGFVYDPVSQTTLYILPNTQADISEAAGLTAFLTYGAAAIFDFDLKIVKSLVPSLTTATHFVGVHFSGDGRDLFLWDNGAHQVRVFDVATWAEVGDIPLPNDDFFASTDSSSSNMALGQNGHLLFLRTQTGFAPIDLDKAGFAPDTPTIGTVGTLGADALTGQDGVDTLSGLGGSDTLTGGHGSDRLVGGPAADAAVYSGFAHDYTLSMRGGDGLVEGGPEGGTDTLSSIEIVDFLDGKLTFDIGSTAAQVLRLYDSFLGRAPDPGGFNSYLNYIASGHTFQDAANNAAASPEFHDATASLSDTQYITYVYEHSLRREPDPGGLQNYLDALHSGALTRTSMIVQAAESPEHVALTAGAVGAGLWVPDEKVEGLELLYDAAVQRQPDPTGVAGYTALLASGTSFRQIANQMASSAEFHAAHDGQTDAQYVDSLYVAEVGRHADAPGLAAYLDELAHGHTRGDLLYETAMSQEHQSHVLAFYDPLLIGA